MKTVKVLVKLPLVFPFNFISYSSPGIKFAGANEVKSS
ncbi:hypothetical protein WEVI103040_10560 [Weeksella virosa]